MSALTDAIQTATAAAAARDRIIRTFVEDFDARASDLERGGMSPQQARTANKGSVFSPPAPGDPVRLVRYTPEAALTDNSLVAVVPSAKDLAGYTIEHLSCYPRWQGFKRQTVAFDAEGICTDAGSQLDTIYPVEAHLLAGDSTATVNHLPSPLRTRVAKILADPVVAAKWPDPFHLFVLGDPMKLRRPVPLGWDGGVMRVLHHRLGDLRAASEYRGTPTA